MEILSWNRNSKIVCWLILLKRESVAERLVTRDNNCARDYEKVIESFQVCQVLKKFLNTNKIGYEFDVSATYMKITKK